MGFLGQKVTDSIAKGRLVEGNIAFQKYRNQQLRI